jgi:crotonobetainyl-CoA:carnitine CoA-transferase CaiB-like acyl-CoA transferase
VPSAAALLELLEGAGVMVARVRSPEENLTDPHLLARGTLQPIEIDGLGERLVPVAPIRMSGAAASAGSPPPRLGQHTGDVLREVLGMPDSDIERLYAERVAFSS